MKKIIAISAIIALSAACTEVASDEGLSDEVSAEVTEVSADAAGFEAVAPGEYEIVHADSTIDRLSIHPGTTWSMVFANDDAVGGTFYAQDGKNCFVTEGVDEHQCFNDSPLADDGSMEVTSEDGTTVTVRPIVEEAE